MKDLKAVDVSARATLIVRVGESLPDRPLDASTWASQKGGPSTSALEQALFAPENVVPSGPFAGTTPLGAGTRPPIGLVNIQAGAEEPPEKPLFGTDVEQLEDARRLGATILRRVGRRELTWNALVDEAIAVPTDAVDVRETVASVANVQAPASWLSAVHAAGLRVVLRCVLDCDSRYVKDERDLWDLEQLLGVAEPILLNWGRRHAAINTVTNYVLDIRVAYQREYLGYIAQGVGDLLLAVRAALQPLAIENIVAGLEVLSGIEDRNVVFGASTAHGQASESGKYWALAWWEATGGLRNVLLRDPEPLDLPFWLPGMTGYYEDKIGSTSTDSRNSLAWRLSFLEHFLAAAARLTMLSPQGVALPELASAISYRWDHRTISIMHGRTTTLGPRHIGHLILDLRQIREVLARAGLRETAVHVLDTGVSVTDDDEALPAWTTDREQFQAREVWRRLLGALAAGATTAGWDAWMSKIDEDTARRTHAEGYGMGLRGDDLDASDPLSTPDLAAPRDSWYAFQRLGQLLKGYAGATLLFPQIGTSNDVQFSEEDCLLIFRVLVSRIGSDARYVYVVMVDPIASSGTKWCVRADWESGEGELFQRVRLDPDSTTDVVTGALSQPEASYDSPTALPLPHSRTVHNTAGPLAFQSDKPLAWTVEWCTETEDAEGPRVPALPRIIEPPWAGEDDTVMIDGVVLL